MGTFVKKFMPLLFLAASQASAGIDPTAPPKSAAAGEGVPAPSELAWVRVNGKQSIAWYGGTTVRLGDVVAEGRVVAIREDHIVIAGKQGRRIVPLLNPGVRIQQPNKAR
jgi:hypothetical protein